MRMGLIKENDIKEEIPLVDVKFTHSLCIGQTGSGKTTSFIYPNLLDRMNRNHGILFFDIKGSEHTAVKALAQEANRLSDVIEIGKPWGRDINILKELNEAKINELLTSLIGSAKTGGQNAYFYNAALSLGVSLYSIFKTSAVLIQEFGELDIDIDFLDKKDFTLEDIYRRTLDMEELYQFIQKVYKFKDKVKKLIFANANLYYTNKESTFKNIILNLHNLEKLFVQVKAYNFNEDDRKDNAGGFDRSLISVVNTLNDSFSFMANSSSKYITALTNALNIVDALQENKIIIINVRVIPDKILEVLLEQVFEQLIDLNIKDEEHRHPTSIFIDEAQRLITKEIPLDVLRSSKVDVILAVQSEMQLISKFGSSEDWKQISINIAQKFAFRSSIYSTDSNSFYPDIGQFDTFEFTKEYDNRIYKSIPKFMDKKELEKIEYKYQHTVLKIDDLNKDEYYVYDVSHYEKEREIIVKNIKTNKKYHKKIFNDLENLIIDKFVNDKFGDVYRISIQNMLNQDIEPDSWETLMRKYGIMNQEIYDDSFVAKYESKTEAKQYILKNKNNKEKYTIAEAFDFIDPKYYFIFKKLPQKRLLELGYKKGPWSVDLKVSKVETLESNIENNEDEDDLSF